MGALAVIADDLTGACDVGAELLPWPGGVVVRPDVRTPAPRAGLDVVNTESRTLPPSAAAAAVTAALEGLRDAGWRGILLKKIDTGLRGSLGAELDAAVDAVGASEAFVLPAIPEVGRTTEDGCQLIEGVPVHLTAFARDPRNPVHEASVAAVLEATCPRRAAVVRLSDVRAPGGVGRAVAAARGAGATLCVCDAVTQADLAAAVEALLARPRPLVLAGSIGLARALRAALAVGTAATTAAADVLAPATGGDDGRPSGEPLGAGADARADGVLAIVGSAHPQSRVQIDAAVARGLVAEVAIPAEAAAIVAAVRRCWRGDITPVLVAPRRPMEGGSAAVLEVLRAAARAVFDQAHPRALVVLGGETAYHVLAGLGHPPLALERRVAPLAVRSRVADGPWRGTVLVTKGGSSGEATLFADMVQELVREGGR